MQSEVERTADVGDWQSEVEEQRMLDDLLSEVERTADVG